MSRASSTVDSDPYLRLPELAAYSTLSIRTLHRLIADPVHPLPVYRPIGKVVLVRRSDFDRWLREHEARVAAPAPALKGLSPAERRIALSLRGYPVEDINNKGEGDDD